MRLQLSGCGLVRIRMNRWVKFQVLDASNSKKWYVETTPKASKSKLRYSVECSSTTDNL